MFLFCRNPGPGVHRQPRMEISTISREKVDRLFGLWTPIRSWIPVQKKHADFDKAKACEVATPEATEQKLKQLGLHWTHWPSKTYAIQAAD